MKYILSCVASAFLGSWLAVSWMDHGDENRAAAGQSTVKESSTDSPQALALLQQQRPGPGPQLPGAPPQPAGEEAPRLNFQQNGLTPEEAINVAVYERVNKGVVNITTRSVGGFFLLDGPSEGTGSGSVVDKAGHILTNYHVIEDARQVSVTLFNGKTYTAEFVGADPINDVAVIKIDASPDVLYPVTFGDSRQLRVGMRVFAIGNPFGLERTMTTGIISSLNRSLKLRRDRSIRSIIQIDAAINPGNSGGPLLDSRGRLIGINTAIATRTGQSAGVGFAIPANTVTRVVPELIDHGRVIRGEHGIQRVYETEAGLLVTRLEPGGPAERAELQGPRVTRTRRGPFIIEQVDQNAADLIIAVDDEKVESFEELNAYIDGKKPGDRVVLTVVRQGQEIKVPLTLGGDERREPFTDR